ncbi:MAG TPA: gamma-glutamyltransferase [Acidimicrobiales bacterium]|nr:gamma-glutamyltransferase [Acidimicrobiales bacterium]
MALVPFSTVRAPGAMVAAADGLATQAGLSVMAGGGNAVDAAIATNAVMAVTGPHLCGMGGDLFALVHHGAAPPAALDASGAAVSGASAVALRAEGHREMPFRHDIRTVTVPGCVDGWLALHGRFGRLPLADVLTPAVALAENGFPASPLLVASLALVDEAGRANLADLASQAEHPGACVRRPGVARALRAIASGGREAWYGGEFGTGLIELGAGAVTAEDLAQQQARWVTPLSVQAFGHDLWTVPPPSQGYLALAGAWLADRLPLPDDPDDPAWAHFLIEAAAGAAYDRPDVLSDRADGPALLAEERLAPRAAGIRADRAGQRYVDAADGDTTYLCTVDRDRTAVSLIQSNAAGFGSWLVEPATGVNLHNRGLGFSLVPGHPAELAPGRRPPHTLVPLLVTRPDGSLAATLGSMGGDAQPQVLLQLLARLFHHGLSPAAAIAAGRWALRGTTGFDTWTVPHGPTVSVEGHAAGDWPDGLAARGHRVERTAAFDGAFGHAHAIVVEATGMLAAAADPRARIAAAAGL